jgi:hypothetical protein
VQFRLATSFLIVLTIGFFVFHKTQKDTEAPRFAESVPPSKSDQELIAHDEFLLLMDEGDEKYLSQVLREFDLTMIAPLEEWVHVARNEANNFERIVALNSPLGQENLDFIAKLEAHPAVHSATLNYLQTAEAMFSCAKTSIDDQTNQPINQVLPSDPYFKYQWHLQKGVGIDLVEAWSITTGNPNTVIAVVDRNFDFAEFDWSPDRCSSRQYYYENILDYFPRNSRPGYPSKETHGSNVLSVLAPCTDNALGLAGIDWSAQVFSVDSKTDASFSTRMLGLLWAAGIDVCTTSIAACNNNQRFQKNMHAANIINASFGFAGTNLKDPPYGPVLDIIGRINREGRIIVASAGNEGGFADRRLPGAAGGVISVGSSNQKHQSSSFSNYGRTIDILAPGENIMGLKNGKAISLNGTSFSSPIGAGVTALMLAVNHQISWKHAEYILKTTANPISCKDYCPDSMAVQARADCQNHCCLQDRVICAAGIADAYQAVRMAKAGIPNTALVDVDDYYLPLSSDNDLKTKIVVKNWGKKPGIVRMKLTDPYLKMTPETIKIAPIDRKGLPGQDIVMIKYNHMPESPTVVSLVLEIANVDNPDIYHDQIEAIVEIVPDPQSGSRNRLLKELLPK